MRVFRYLMAGVLASIWSACGSDRVTLVNFGPPFATGTITATDSTHRFLVEATPGTTSPAKVFFSVTTNTTIERPDGSEGSRDDLVIGKIIAVWPASVAPGSDPPELVALHVLLYQR